MAGVWVVSFLLAFCASNFAAEDGGKIKARLEVKQFINEDAGKYPDLEVKYIGGLDPVLVFLKEGGEDEIERVPVAEKARHEINELLASHGLTQKVEPEEEAEETGEEESAEKETGEEQPAEEEQEETGEEQPAEEEQEEAGEEQPAEEEQEETGEEQPAEEEWEQETVKENKHAKVEL